MQNKLKGKVFTAQEVQRIIAGQKTNFREVVKPTPWHVVIDGDFKKGNNIPKHGHDEKEIKPPYKVGEEIFVKESFWVNKKHGKFCWYDQDIFECGDSVIKKPAQHMKQEHSRLFLRITGIKIERLQNISRADCSSEGEDQWSFICNWNATHKKPEEKFEASPWVFVYTFEVVR